MRQFRDSKGFYVLVAPVVDDAAVDDLRIAALELRRGKRPLLKCLEQLLWTLQTEGVNKIWLDKRTGSLNRRDLRHFDRLRAQQVLAAETRIGFAHCFNGSDGEPLLWLADAAAGAASTAYGDGDRGHLDLLHDRISQEITIELT